MNLSEGIMSEYLFPAIGVFGAIALLMLSLAVLAAMERARFFHWLLRRCYLCGKRGNVLTVKRISSYYADIYRYHSGCLTRVLDNPEECGHAEVDLALDILDCVTMNREEQRQAHKRREKRLMDARAFLEGRHESS